MQIGGQIDSHISPMLNRNLKICVTRMLHSGFPHGNDQKIKIAKPTISLH